MVRRSLEAFHLYDTRVSLLTKFSYQLKVQMLQQSLQRLNWMLPVISKHSSLLGLEATPNLLADVLDAILSRLKSNDG